MLAVDSDVRWSSLVASKLLGYVAVADKEIPRDCTTKRARAIVG